MDFKFEPGLIYTSNMIFLFHVSFIRLWVHFTCLWFISFYGLYLLYKVSCSLVFSCFTRIFSLRSTYGMVFFLSEVQVCKGWLPASFHIQEYSEIMIKRIQQLRNIRHRPDQFTVLVRQIPICAEHQTRGCSVDHFFSKHYPNSYYSCQMLYEGKALQDLLVRFEHFVLVFAINAFDVVDTKSFIVSTPKWIIFDYVDTKNLTYSCSWGLESFGSI